MTTRLFVIALLATNTLAADWSQVLGPTRDGVAGDGEKITDVFAPDGPPVLWKKRLGEGYAGPAVSGGKLILFHREGNEDVVECLRAETGEPVWRFAYPTRYRDGYSSDHGPRATPTIDAGRVYTYGANGMLHALDMETGRAVWKVDAAVKYGSRPGFFGRGSSPLVEGRLLIAQVGGEGGAGIVALDKATGELVWKATDDEASYASPIATNVGGRRTILVLTREALVGLEPADGQVLFRKPFRASIDASVNAATPIVRGEEVFLTASYNVGAALWRLTPEGLREVWANDQTLSSQFATPVLRDGLLFGFHGRQDTGPKAVLRCVEWETGRVVWSSEPLGVGSVIGADGKLIVLTEEGELLIVPASPDRFTPSVRAQVLGFGIRALPALSNGLYFARDTRQIACVDLRPGGAP